MEDKVAERIVQIDLYKTMVALASGQRKIETDGR